MIKNKTTKKTLTIDKMKPGDITTSKCKQKDVDFVFKELLMNYYTDNKTLIWGVIIMTFPNFSVESIVLPLNYSKLFDSVKSASKTKSMLYYS